MADRKRVLILCTGNSARSQMAEGILRHDGGGRFEVESAGVNPSRVRPEAVEAMREVGIDISSHRSKSADEFVGQDFDYIITVCDNARKTCPFFPGTAERIHHSFEDPPTPGAADPDATMAIFRRVRDEIREWMQEFMSEAGKSRKETPVESKEPPFKIIFLCTGNSARSIFGEYLIRKVGGTLFQSYSAGSLPAGRVNPVTLDVLREVYQIDAGDARSKGCDEFRGVDFDFVITVCDKARETCPVWPGQPIVAHWGVPDPALTAGTAAEVFQEFKRVSMMIKRRIDLFCSLPFDKIDRLRLETLTRGIGEA